MLHREIVVLTGLLASNYWEHVVYTQPNGGERYARELEARGIPTGIILAENDPLIEYLRHQLSTYRFLSHHWRLRDSLFPDETTRHPKPRRPETNHRLFPVLR